MSSLVSKHMAVRERELGLTRATLVANIICRLALKDNGPITLSRKFHPHVASTHYGWSNPSF